MRRYLQLIQVAQVAQLLQDGTSLRAVARRFSVSLPAWSQKRGGDARRRAITRGELDRALEWQQTSTARALQNDCQWATCVHGSDQTIRNRLHEGGMRPRYPGVRPVLTAQHHATRLAFAREHLWCSVLFTDESRFTIGMWQMWKSLETPCWKLCCLQHNPAWPVWRWVSDGLGRHILGGSHKHPRASQRYPDCSLVPGLNPQTHCQTLRWCSGPWVPPGAGQCPASCRQSMQSVPGWWKALMPLTGCYLTFLTENLWDVMYRCIRHRQVAPQTVQELTDALIQFWEEILQETIHRLIRRIPRRCQGRGNHTHYWATLWVVVMTFTVSLWSQFFTLIFSVILNPALSGLMI